jgi:hypothetical protein
MLITAKGCENGLKKEAFAGWIYAMPTMGAAPLPNPVLRAAATAYDL